jgi:lipopolysaccharide export LptBFGC system permease protein LptF
VFYCFSFNILIVTTVSNAKNTINSIKKLVFSITEVEEMLFKIGRTNMKQVIIFTVVTIKKVIPTKSKLRARIWNTDNNRSKEKIPKNRYKLKSEYEKKSWAIPINSKTY